MRLFLFISKIVLLSVILTSWAEPFDTTAPVQQFQKALPEEEPSTEQPPSTTQPASPPQQSPKVQQPSTAQPQSPSTPTQQPSTATSPQSSLNSGNSTMAPQNAAPQVNSGQTTTATPDYSFTPPPIPAAPALPAAPSVPPAASVPTNNILHQSSMANGSASNATNSEGLQLIQDQVSQLNQNQILFQEKINHQLDDLSQRIQSVENRALQLAQAMQMMNHEITGLNKAAGSLQAVENAPPAVSVSISRWGMEWYQKLGPIVFYAIVGLLFILLCIMLWVIIRPRSRKFSKEAPHIHSSTYAHVKDHSHSRKSPLQQSDLGWSNEPQFDKQQPEAAEEPEYDYLGSEEGIRAKLNLARAYIAMEDYASAIELLNAVIEKGDEGLKLEATALKEQISKHLSG